MAGMAAGAIVVGFGSLAAMGYYNWRLYGDPLKPPYQVNRSTYAVAPLFIWQNLRPQPAYRHKEMQTFYTRLEADQFLRIKSVSGFLTEICRKAGNAGAFFFAAALLPPLILLPKVLFDRRLRSLLVIAAVFCLGLSVNAWLFAHYVAPVTGIVYAVLIQCMRHLRTVTLGGAPAGRLIVGMLVLVCLLTAGLRVAAQPLHIRVERLPNLWYGTEPLGLARAGLAAKVRALPGQHLLIIRYAPNHDPLDEWVYNKADIDGAKIVWAHEMSPEQNRELIHYYSNRQVWLVEPDADPPRLSPYADSVPRPGTLLMHEHGSDGIFEILMPPRQIGQDSRHGGVALQHAKLDVILLQQNLRILFELRPFLKCFQHACPIEHVRATIDKYLVFG